MVGTAVAVVTGANSFIATEIIAQLLHKGYSVRATVRNADDPAKVEHLTKLADAFPGELSFHEAELGVLGAFHSVVKGANYVYHCAANLDMESYNVSKGERKGIVQKAVESQVDIVRAAAASKDTVRGMVITSSMAAVKPFEAIRKQPWNEEDWNALTEEQMEKNTYLYIKTLTEKKSFEVAAELGVPLSSIVPSFVIGPVISGELGFSPYVVKNVLEDGRGDAMWLATAVDVRDVARAHILAAEKSGPGARYLVARSHPLPPGQMVDSLRAMLPGYKIDDDNVARRGVYNPNFHIFDTRKAQDELGLQFTDVQESFHDMIFSMLKKGMLNLQPTDTTAAA